MGKKKVTFSSIVKIVTHNGEIRHERDWGATPFDFLGQTENIDFIQQQFEQKLSILGHTGKEDLERLQELSVPFFNCAGNMAHKMGAMEYLRLLAETPLCGPIPPCNNNNDNNKAHAIMLATLPKRKSDKRTKEGRKRGTFKHKEIPGRHSPELRKLILMARSQEPKIFEKYYVGMGKKSIKNPTPILKSAKSEFDAKPFIDLTYIDPTGLFGSDEGFEDEDTRDCTFWDDGRRDQSEEPRFSESIAHSHETLWSSGKAFRVPHNPSCLIGLPEENCSLLSDDDAERSPAEYKPDPEATLILTDTSLPSSRYRLVLPTMTLRRGIPAE